MAERNGLTVHKRKRTSELYELQTGYQFMSEIAENRYNLPLREDGSIYLTDGLWVKPDGKLYDSKGR